MCDRFIAVNNQKENSKYQQNKDISFRWSDKFNLNWIH